MDPVQAVFLYFVVKKDAIAAHGLRVSLPQLLLYLGVRCGAGSVSPAFKLCPS